MTVSALRHTTIWSRQGVRQHGLRAIVLLIPIFATSLVFGDEIYTNYRNLIFSQEICDVEDPKNMAPEFDLKELNAVTSFRIRANCAWIATRPGVWFDNGVLTVAVSSTDQQFTTECTCSRKLQFRFTLYGSGFPDGIDEVAYTLDGVVVDKLPLSNGYGQRR